MATEYVSGLDLGQLQDHTALVVVVVEVEGGRLGVRRAHRWPLGTPYTQIVADLVSMFAIAPLADTTLVVDQTGVGVAVLDMIRESAIRAHVVPYTITCGQHPGDASVPKKDLVGAVPAGLGTERLRFAEGLKHGPVLKAELESFRAKVTADRNESFSAWRERDSDDLVLALALACFYADRYGGSSGCLGGPFGATPFDSLPPDTFR